ncbi:MAG TPA: N-acetylglucosamine-6-phosphate deacetylase [Terriglobales bacterium]|nr:N-acetylglucosamine-6-phosphate deacetylase [Terriglobales bacterium]
MITALTAAELWTPLERIADAVVLVEDRVVTAVGPRSAVAIPPRAHVNDFGANVLAPGYVDIHVHGGAGIDVMSAAADGRAAMESLLARHGVTTYCPTTVTAPLDATLRALERLGDAITGNHPDPLARPIGIHLEGPFISHAKRGVHPPADIAAPSVRLFERFWQASQGHIALMTIAPELEGAAEVIAAAVRHGVCVSLGHSNAELAAARAAIAAGARHATHTFNAMRALDHREPGIAGCVLSDDRVTADIIADGIHVDPAMVGLFLKAKGAENAVLITDAISATGMGDGTFQLGAFTVEVRGDRCLHDGKLAGSVLTMERAVVNVMEFAGWELGPALRLASLNPARVIGRQRERGRIAPGARADIVVVTPSGEVVTTFCGGVEFES